MSTYTHIWRSLQARVMCERRENGVCVWREGGYKTVTNHRIREEDW